MLMLTFAWCLLARHVLSSPLPQQNGDIISYIRMVDKKVDAINTTIVKELVNVESNVDSLAKMLPAYGKQQWKLQEKNRCFGPKNREFGSFTLKNEGRVMAVKLVYKSGLVKSCHSYYKSYWGCRDKTSIFTYITDNHNRIVFPKTLIASQVPEVHRDTLIASHGDTLFRTYTLIGYDNMSEELVLTDYATSIYGTVGMELRVWYGARLFGMREYNNGRTCADVYAMFG